MLRDGKHPLTQIANRLTERLFVSDFNFRDNSECKQPVIRYGKRNKCEIVTNEFKLSNTKFHDMWFKAGDKIFKMGNAFEINSEFFIEGYEIESYTDFFENPLKSSLLNIFIANVSDIEQRPLKRINIRDIGCKFVCIQHSNEDTYVFIPLLHTIK